MEMGRFPVTVCVGAYGRKKETGACYSLWPDISVNIYFHGELSGLCLVCMNDPEWNIFDTVINDAIIYKSWFITHKHFSDIQQQKHQCDWVAFCTLGHAFMTTTS